MILNLKYESDTTLNRSVLASEVSRDDYILESFKRDFPTYKDITLDEVKEFISRSEPVKRWFIGIMETFRITFEMPEVAREILPQGEFMKIKGSLETYTDSLRDEGEEIQKLSRKFSSDIDKIRSHHETLRNKLKDIKLLEILTLTSDKLPMSDQFKIIQYEEKGPNHVVNSEGEVLNKKQYHKLLFNNYIKLLIQKYLEGEDTSSLIKENLFA